MFQQPNLLQERLFRAAERMMENIGYKKPDYMEIGVKTFKKIDLVDKLKGMLGTKILVYVDKPIGTPYPDDKITKYKINCGYVTGFSTPSKENLRAYIVGVKEPLKEFDGVLYAIVNRKKDFEDRIVVLKEGEKISDKKIEKAIAFEEKRFRHKPIK